MRKKVKDAVEDLKLLAERWDTTKVWHKSLFLEGEIHITTGDLRSIGIVLKHLESLEGKLNLRKIFWDIFKQCFHNWISVLHLFWNLI